MQLSDSVFWLEYASNNYHRVCHSLYSYSKGAKLLCSYMFVTVFYREQALKVLELELQHNGDSLLIVACPYAVI